MAAIFVSYRRADSQLLAAALADHLVTAFGPEQVFRDADTLIPGSPWPQGLTDALGAARVLVAVIGPGWLTAPDGTRRLDDPNDWVRREIRTSLERGIPVVPVLLDDTPPPTGLPTDLASLTKLQTLRVRHDRFRADVDRLAAALVEHVPALLVDRVFEADPTPLTAPVRQPSVLLRAEHEVVAFAGRVTEIETLRTWLDSPPPLAAHLITGPGGAGKTRLARTLVADARQAGWTAGTLRDDAPLDVVVRLAAVPDGSAAGVDPTAGLLLVVDYAEGRAAKLAALIPTLHVTQRVRLLLLARSDAGWVRQLERSRDERVADLADALTRQRLAPLAPAPADRFAEFDRAVAAFAPWLDRPEATPPPVPLRDGDALDVHAAALAALLDDTAQTATDTDPIRRVLRHEERYWAATTTDLPDPHDGRLAQVITAATLCGAADDPAADRLLSALPTFTDFPHDTVDRYRRWAQRVLPLGPGLAPLRPDRLGEELVAATVADVLGLVGALASGLDDAQCARALTVLGRAAARHPELTAAIRTVLAVDLPRRLPVALAVATGAGASGNLPEIIDRILASSPEHAELVADALPDSSLVLAGLAVVATRAAVDQALASGAPPDEFARLTHNLAVRLGDVGRSDEALLAAADAVARFCALDDPAELGSALSFLAMCHSALGLPDDALAPALQAVKVLRTAPAASHLLATALQNAGNVLGDLGRHTEAEAYLREAIGLLRAEVATADDADDALRRLSLGLDVLGATLAATGRTDEALDLAEDATTIVRDLDDRDPDRFRSDLVRALVNLSGTRAEVGDIDGGLMVADEAVTLARTIVADHGDRHLAGLADALNNHAVLLRTADRPGDALVRIEEAVLLFRTLATERPGAELPSLAAALLNLAHVQEQLGRTDAAFDAADEAVELYDKLAGPRPDVHGPDLAAALRSRADVHSERDDPVAALADLAGAVALLDELATAQRHDLLRSLALSLHARSRVHLDLDDLDAAVTDSARAVGLFRGLPERDALEWVTLLHGHGDLLDVAGRHAEAEPVLADAAAAARALPDRDRDDRLAAILHNQALCRSTLDDHDGALPLITEAVALRRSLVGAGGGDPAELAESLNNLADTLHDLGDDDAAREPAEEAVTICANPENGCSDELFAAARATLEGLR